MSLTTQFAEGPIIPEIDGSEDDDSEDEEVETVAPEGGEADGSSDSGSIGALPQAASRGWSCPPSLATGCASLTRCSQTCFRAWKSGQRARRTGKEDLFIALMKTVRDTDYVAKPTPVNIDNYGGRLMLLPGSPDLHKFSHDLECNEDTSFAAQHFGAFRKAMISMACAVQAQFVIVDLGPHTDTLHKDLLCSCDAILPVVNACIFSCYSTRSMLHGQLPRWIDWHAKFTARNTTPAAYALPRQFPRILPFMVNNYDMKLNGKQQSAQWSHSNFVESLRMIVEGERLHDDEEPLPEKVQELYVPTFKRGSKTKETMVVPLLKHLQYLPVAQECGRALFDLDANNMRDYYQHSFEQVDLAKVEEEKRYVKTKLAALGSGVLALHAYLRKQRQREQQEAQRKKREREEQQQQGLGSGSSGRKKAEVQQQQQQGGGGNATRRKGKAPARLPHGG
ncbi:chromosome partitioning [Micractinium conductrix]|uniref:Chromosome partitioning n=1 Tax=Micractinium conductrix TaxID=554055 RepID=A0A2P6V9J5_9CHLO|nr:chromosome partitioning [Micractinium conductrix]|eukprot:PSC70756.1 chromosome partitioning [Micractinium conductrix]